MKKNFTLTFALLLCFFSIGGNAQTQFWGDTFDALPTSGTRTPEENGGVGGPPNTSYFRLTDGSTVSQTVPFTGKQGTSFWAGEDHNAAGTGFTSSGAQGAATNSPLNELSINWTGINISGKSGLSFRGLFAANSTNEPWDNTNACISGVGTTNTDYIIVQYRIDGGAYTDLIRFFNRGSATNGVDKYLFEDTDGNGCGDGIQLTNAFGEFIKTISGTGTTLDIRINIYSEGNNEEWAIDNFRLFETPVCTAPTITANPPNRTICAGNNTTFTASATGATGYQWQVNTGSGFTDLTNVAPYSNVTTNTMTITGATAGMSGYLYRCVTYNGTISCFTNSNQATLTVSSINTATGSQINVSCNGGNNGSATVTPSGGIAPYSYSWSPSGGTGATASGLSVGSYTVTITDNISCTATRNYTITQPPALNGTTVVTNVACNGGTTGAINLTPSGGTPPYTFNWGGGITTEDRTGLAAGSYSVIITDNNGCTRTVSSIIVTQPTAVNGTTVVTNIACFGGTTGAINLTPTGGTGPYTFNWGGGITTEDRTGLAAGTYSVTITDNNGCTGTVSGITVTQPVAAVSGTTVVTNVACFGGTTGAINLTPTGGTGPYTFNWGGGITTEDRTGLAAGTYSVTITDNNGCTGTVSGITVTQPVAAVSGTTVVTNIACFGGTTGAINLTPTGGTGPYTFNWGGGITTEDRTGLAAGTYSVTITDNNGCTGTVSGITVTEPTAISLTAASQTNIACNGGSNGAAAVNIPTGGTPGYTYDWTPGTPTGDGTTSVTGLTAGTWTCTVTDANGCTASQSFTVTQPSAISLTAASQTNIACNGGSNGAAAVNIPTGGTPGYTYDWTPGTPTGDGTTSATGLTAGTWTCTVTDANGCTASQSFTVTQPTAISLTAASQTNIACNGGSNGAAAVNIPTGGTPGYTYDWTPGTPTGDGTTSVTGLTAGTWTCTVTDANGCTASQSFTVTQPTAISLTAASQTNIACNGGSNGAAAVNIPTGGTPGYTYDWTPGTPTGDGTISVTGLTAGTWTCTVTDANGCTASQSFTVTQPSAISLTAASQTNIACNGGSNGAATVNIPTGGTPGYTYDWTPGTPTGDGTTSATGLTAGTWTCTVTDANGCTASQSFTVTQPTAISLTAASQTNIACNGGSNGAAAVNIPTGGTPGYTYDWTPGTPTGDGTTSVTGLTAGTWTCTVTDANGCTASQSFTVTQPSAISLTAASQTNIACNGGSNGAAAVNIPTGGTPGYTYDWTPGTPTGDGTTSATGLTAGTWTCTVTDANGCTASQSFTVTQPTAISLTAASQTNIACNGGSNGAAAVNIPTGGTPGYTYDWTPGTPTGDGTISVSGLTAGTWTCTVTDANGCTASQSFTVTQPSAIDNNVTLTSGILSATQTGATYQWYQCPNTILIGETNQTFTPTVVGDYKVEITLGGCTSTSACVTVTILGNESFDNSNFTYYPNPTSDILNISSDNLIDDIQVINMLGQEIISTQFKSKEIQLNLSTLPTATYFIKVNSEGKSKTIKILKQ